MAVHDQDPYSKHFEDSDPQETQEWRDSLDAVIDERGRQRGRDIMLSLLKRSKERHLGVPMVPVTDYVNTIAPEDEAAFPGDEAIERRYRRWIRWNAAMTVQRAQRPGVSVGGHISSYASQSSLYEVGLNHFFRGYDHPQCPDQVFFQGHASPGNYARAYLQGQLTAEQLDGFRQQQSQAPHGLPSYPHPRQSREFWQFPTVSMGLGPLAAIWQANFNKYLANRGIKDTAESHVWAYLGDGEMDEVESRGQLQFAANNRLDNLTFVVNCNLQRLDGPVRGNGKIIQELESFFRGAGWHVIKIIWGREWDDLLARDESGALLNLMNETPDGDYQTYKAESGAFVREHFFGRDPRALELVKDYTDDQIWGLKRGGHDYRKVYAAYAEAMQHKGQPTVILAKTVKGYGLGTHFEGRNATHQMKKLTFDDLKTFRDAMQVPITDAQLEGVYDAPYYHPGEDDEAIQYLLERRRQLGGFVPERRSKYTQLDLPEEKTYAVTKKGSGTQEVASTMAFVRLLKDLMRAGEFGKRIVPIIPDEARTFGVDAFFPTAKIYNPNGQHYMSVDRELLLAYRESEQGVIQHVGINEAGAMGAFTAAGSSYSTHGEIVVPMYMYYSMFGFQRTADSMWAAADQLARGFLLGATAGRTTLAGEGLQHMDGHSHVIAATNPAVVSYDPAYGYEIGHIVRDGIERMYGGTHPDPDVMYYITMYNEPMVQPAEPEHLDREGLLKGIYYLRGTEQQGPRVQLLASGVAVPWALHAQELLAADWGVAAEVWSVTSWSELRRDGLAAEQHNWTHPHEEPRVPYLTDKLSGSGGGPFIGVSDFAHSVPDMIRPFVPGDYATLGADDFGISDTRPAARRYYLIDSHSIVVRALERLASKGELDRGIVQQAIDRYDLHNPKAGETGTTGGDA